MGNYYRAVCDELRQKIDPGGITPGLGDKALAISHPDHPFGAMLTYAMVSGQFWGKRHVRLIHDNDECDEDAYRNYKDITESLVIEYRRDFTQPDLELHHRLLRDDEPLESGDNFSVNGGKTWYCCKEKERIVGRIYSRYESPYAMSAEEEREMNEYYGEDL